MKEKGALDVIALCAFAIIATAAAGEWLSAQNGLFVLLSFMALSLVIAACAAYSARERGVEPMACGIIGAVLGFVGAVSEALFRWALVYSGAVPYIAPGAALSFGDAASLFIRDAAAGALFWVFAGIVLGLAGAFLAQRFSKKE